MPHDFAVSIIIPLYGRRDLTTACLASIMACTPDDLYEVVLVDNASPDDTGELLAALEGDVTIIGNDVNLGFAKACNQGAEAARGELLLFLNSDIEATPGWLPAMIRPLRREPGVGAVGARLVYPDRRIQHAGCLLVEDAANANVECHHRHRGEPEDHPPALEALDLQAVTAAAMLVRRDAFEAAGGFDEGYWNGHEDIDLCLRLREAGWRIRYEPAALLVHHEGASGPERLTAVDANGRRFAERWIGRFRPDLVRTGSQVADPGMTVGPDHPEPALALNLWRLTRAAADQRGAAPRLDGSDAEWLRDRLQQEEERRLLDLARAGRDVCWEDEGDPLPLVTVRIPTFRRGAVLAERAIAAALAQTYPNIEVLVIGDAADDATVDAATSTGDARVRFVNLPRRGVYPTEMMDLWRVGGVDPANTGLDLARGSWIAPCDDDDEFTPDHVEVLLAAARAQRLEMVWSKARMEIATDRWMEVGEAPLRHGGLSHGSVLYAAPLRFMKYSRTCWKLDEPADWNLWRRMQAIGVRMGFVDHVTYVHYLEAHQRHLVGSDSSVGSERDGAPSALGAVSASGPPAREGLLRREELHLRTGSPSSVGSERDGAPSALGAVSASGPPAPEGRLRREELHLRTGSSEPAAGATGVAVLDRPVVRMHLGCGPNRMDGWVNVDVEESYGPDIVHDLSEGLPAEDGTVDLVYSEHFWEHLHIDDGVQLMADCWRALKPGGVLRIAMPDLAECVRRYLGDWRGEAWIQQPAYDWVDTPARMLNASFREWEHKYLYDAPDVTRRLLGVGFSEVRVCAWGESDVDGLRGLETRPESLLVVEAVR